MTEQVACPYCESVNAFGAGNCQACGAPLGRAKLAELPTRQLPLDAVISISPDYASGVRVYSLTAWGVTQTVRIDTQALVYRYRDIYTVAQEIARQLSFAWNINVFELQAVGDRDLAGRQVITNIQPLPIYNTKVPIPPMELK